MTPDAATGRRSPLLVRAGLSMLLLGSFGAAVPALLLLAIATAHNSRLFCLALLASLSVPAWWAAARLFARRAPPAAAVATALLLAGGLGAWCVLCSPTGRVSPQSCLRSAYRGPARLHHLSPAWLVDEADQVKLGGILLPLLDPAMSREQGRHFAATFNAAYAKLGRAPDFVLIGSAMGEAYADMFLRAPPVGHAYVYHPSVSRRQRCPVVVFLHGWLGNLKAYVWSWSRFADRNRFVVICPSFGNGLWQGKDAEETLQWIDALIRADPSCDPDRVYVVGLSNGGTGVTRWATRLPHTYRGLVFVSPVLEGTDAPAFASAVGARPVLVVHGDADNRIPPAYVRERVRRMSEAGLHVRALCYPGEDHVLVLSASEKPQSDMREWMIYKSAVCCCRD